MKLNLLFIVVQVYVNYFLKIISIVTAPKLIMSVQSKYVLLNTYFSPYCVVYFVSFRV